MTNPSLTEWSFATDLRVRLVPMAICATRRDGMPDLVRRVPVRRLMQRIEMGVRP